jgi:hypothetical protein
MICSEECEFLSRDPSSKSRRHEINVHLLKRERERERERWICSSTKRRIQWPTFSLFEDRKSSHAILKSCSHSSFSLSQLTQKNTNTPNSRWAAQDVHFLISFDHAKKWQVQCGRRTTTRNRIIKCSPEYKCRKPSKSSKET